jgi:hypothetical protein
MEASYEEWAIPNPSNIMKPPSSGFFFLLLFAQSDYSLCAGETAQ